MAETVQATCADCGSPMRQRYIILTFATGCERIPDGHPCCTNQVCRDRQAAEDCADRANADKVALDRAMASGVVVPDDTPEEDRWVR